MTTDFIAADFAAAIVLISGALATITDLYQRRIPRWLTLPVFLLGLIVSFIPYIIFLPTLRPDREGLLFTASLLWNWLGPSLISFIYSLFLFWLGMWGGGDGQFIIAITPWCGLFQVWKIILYFYPVAMIYLSICLLIRYRFKISEIIRRQVEDTAGIIKSRGKKSGRDSEDGKCEIPGMVAIYCSVILSYLV